jgi:glycogen synthase
VTRLCLITREYADDTVFGGIGRIMNMQAQILAAAGAEVHVITVAASTRTHYVEHGVHVHRLPAPKVTTRPDMYYVTLAEWSKAVSDAYAELDARWRFDAVDTPEHWGEALHLPLRPETALIVTLHGLSALLEPHSLSEAPTVGQRVLYDLEVNALRRADRIIAPTELILEDTRALLGSDAPPATVLPHAFDPSRFPARPPRAPEPGRRRLLFTGRLEGRKGVDFALRAAAATARRGYETELVIAGRDWTNYRRRVLEPLSEELGFSAVTYLGEVHERKISELLRDADCVIMPSRQENFHMAANEALASGVPVITSDVNGVTCWYDRERGMLALPLEDPARFGELAADAIADDAWLTDAGARGAERVRTLLAPERIGAELLRVYTQEAERKRAALPPAAPAAPAPAPAAGELRRLRIAASADELLRRPDLLGAYAAAIGPDDDATLVVHGAGAGALLAAAGVHAVVRGESGPPARCAAVLSEGPTPAALADLPRVGVGSALALRPLLEGGAS